MALYNGGEIWDDDGVDNVIVPSTWSAGARICSHVWIDPEIWGTLARRVIPLIGDGPKMMRPGKRYTCLNCGLTLDIPKARHDDADHNRMGSERGRLDRPHGQPDPRP